MYRPVSTRITRKIIPFARLLSGIIQPFSPPHYASLHCSSFALAAANSSPLPLDSLKPLPSPRTHVIVIGGGSLGLFHASLFQLRFQHPMHSNNEQRTEYSTTSSVRVISAQQQLLQHLPTTGVRLDLLLDFIRAERSWMPIDVSEKELAASQGKSHFLLPQTVKIPAAASITLSLQPGDSPTHVLIIVKGAAAVKRAASDLYQVCTKLHEAHQPLPAICILMNGMGHVELIVDQWKELLQSDARRHSVSSQAKLLDLFQSRLFTATTTNGAKLEKTFAEKDSSNATVTGDLPLIELRVKHGGMGSTTVVQNAWEANAEKQHTSKHPTSSAATSQLIGSSSFVTLFRSIGFETHFAPHSAAQSVLYTKLLVNCVINPLTALHYVQNGQLRAPEFTEWIVHLAQECVCIINRLGISISDYPVNREGEAQMYPENLESFLPRDAPEDLKRALFHVYMTAHRTFHNYSSMVNDLHALQVANRPRTTEIDNITGFLLKKARSLGVTPEQISYNQEVFDRVQQAEQLFAVEPQRARTSSPPIPKLK